MSLPCGSVWFAHGKESGPWGTKISYLADAARALGWSVESPDYRFSLDPVPRLAALASKARPAGHLVLVGSSMGAYVSAMACAALKPDALMLMAPALYFDGYAEEPEAIPPLCSVVHGWRDEIVPVERAWRFAQAHRARLLVLDSDHGLNDQLPVLAEVLAELLAAVVAQPPVSRAVST